MLSKTVVLLILTFAWLVLPVRPIFAQGTPWSAGHCVDASNTDVPTIQGFECLFANILQIIIATAGLVFFIMFIKGGFTFMLSQGDAKALAANQQAMLTTLIGIAGAIGSFILIKTLSSITGLDLTTFKIPF